MLKNILDCCGAAVAFYGLGFAFAFGGNEEGVTFVGTANFFGSSTEENSVDSAFWFFQFCFSATAVTIVAGTLAERCQMAAYLWYSLFLCGFVYPVVSHAVWSANGYFSTGLNDPLRDVGTIDFAGSGVVHITGGTTALVATAVLGARTGRFRNTMGELLEVPKEFPGHSMALQLMGTLVLWFGCKLVSRTGAKLTLVFFRVRIQPWLGFVAGY